MIWSYSKMDANDPVKQCSDNEVDRDKPTGRAKITQKQLIIPDVCIETTKDTMVSSKWKRSTKDW